MESLTIVDLRAEQESITEDIETNLYLIKQLEESFKLFENSPSVKEKILSTMRVYTDEIWNLTKRNTEICKKLKCLHNVF